MSEPLSEDEEEVSGEPSRSPDAPTAFFFSTLFHLIDTFDLYVRIARMTVTHR
jgi:hypothetical protein